MIFSESCNLPRVVGPCTASVPSWYHDAETGSCKSFIYGGCLGNNNRHGSREECEEMCVVPEKTGTSVFFVVIQVGMWLGVFIIAATNILEVCSVMCPKYLLGKDHFHILIFISLFQVVLLLYSFPFYSMYILLMENFCFNYLA